MKNNRQQRDPGAFTAPTPGKVPTSALLKSKSKILRWTHHAEAKLRQYGLSPSRIRRVLHTPLRIEEGVAPETVAFMQPTSYTKNTGKEKDWKQEIWVMTEEKKEERLIVSVWRYPGKTKPGEPIPDEILRELDRIKLGG